MTDHMTEQKTEQKTLRDEFAMAALGGYMASGDAFQRAMPEHEKRIREALEAGPVQYACHADGEVSQSCAFDAGQYLRDCRIAVRLNAKGQCKTDCEQWKPLNLNTSTVQISADDLRALLADLDAMRVKAARYDYLSERFVGADFDWNESGESMLVFKIEDGTQVWGSADETIDTAITALKGAEA